MTDSGVSPRGSGESKVRVLRNGYHRMLQNLVSQMNKLQCTEESGLAQNHEADSGTDRTQVQYFLSGQSGEWKHVLPGACRHHTTYHFWRRLQNNFSLPELQCFISDSQLTRDAALHLRLGDRTPCRSAPGVDGRELTLCRRRGIRGASAPPSSSCPGGCCSYTGCASCPPPGM